MRIRTAALLAALALSVAACGGSDEDTTDSAAASPEPAASSFPAGSTMERIAKAGELKVGTKFDQPLYGEKQLDGSLTGFDIEIAKMVAKSLGVEPKFTEAVSKNREPFIENGTVDIVVATYTINDKRKEVVSFAGPYYLTGQGIMVNKDNDAIKGKDDLPGKKVCSVEGSTPAERIRTDVPKAQLTTFDTYGKCAEAMKNGQVDAVTTDEAILLGLVDKSPDDFKTVGRPFSDEPYGIGLKKDDTEFRNYINDVLQKSYDDGSWEKALKDTVGKVQEELPSPPKIDRYTS